MVCWWCVGGNYPNIFIPQNRRSPAPHRVFFPQRRSMHRLTMVTRACSRMVSDAAAAAQQPGGGLLIYWQLTVAAVAVARSTTSVHVTAQLFQPKRANLMLAIASSATQATLGSQQQPLSLNPPPQACRARSDGTPHHATPRQQAGQPPTRNASGQHARHAQPSTTHTNCMPHSEAGLDAQ